MPDGYYWARHPDGSYFVVLHENDLWYCCGLGFPMADFHESQVVMPLHKPVNDMDEWRTIKGISKDGVTVTVRSKLKFTFTDPKEVLRKYKAGELELGDYEAQRPGELPGSTIVSIEKL